MFTRLGLSRFALSTQSLVVAFVLATPVVLLQFFSLAGGGAPSGRLLVVLAVPMGFLVFAAWFYTWWVTRKRVGVLTQAFSQISAGELQTELPAVLNSAENRALAGAFSKMGQALAQKTSQLRHADQQRRRLFADLAHELATPISSVLGIADALAEPERFSEDERVRLTAHLSHEAARLQHLANDVRALAILDDPESPITVQTIDVGALVRNAVERALVLTGDRVVITCRADAAACEADPQRVDQVLANLLGNALRYTPDGGQVVVAVTAGTARTQPGVLITVEDSGAGVPDELLPRLGERLFRIDPSRNRKTGGQGLGLSIVAAIVERHQGELRFERAALGGLRVVVALPVAQGATHTT